jgi:hypothetical protein
MILSLTQADEFWVQCSHNCDTLAHGIPELESLDLTVFKLDLQKQLMCLRHFLQISKKTASFLLLLGWLHAVRDVSHFSGSISCSQFIISLIELKTFLCCPFVSMRKQLAIRLSGRKRL